MNISAQANSRAGNVDSQNVSNHHKRLLSKILWWSMLDRIGLGPFWRIGKSSWARLSRRLIITHDTQKSRQWVIEIRGFRLQSIDHRLNPSLTTIESCFAPSLVLCLCSVWLVVLRLLLRSPSSHDSRTFRRCTHPHHSMC